MRVLQIRDFIVIGSSVKAACFAEPLDEVTLVQSGLLLLQPLISANNHKSVILGLA